MSKAPLDKLLAAVDVATWAWSVKQHTIKGRRCQADWRGAMNELVDAWEQYQIETSDLVPVLSSAEAKP